MILIKLTKLVLLFLNICFKDLFFISNFKAIYTSTKKISKLISYEFFFYYPMTEFKMKFRLNCLIRLTNKSTHIE